ncbi:MAG: hypothetical protein HUJ25_05240 [Crocinitomicaceae bacterium]|nr:hypothetical protein [Crocinitomicaceae bacterium]
MKTENQKRKNVQTMMFAAVMLVGMSFFTACNSTSEDEDTTENDPKIETDSTTVIEEPVDSVDTTDSTEVEDIIENEVSE